MMQRWVSTGRAATRVGTVIVAVAAVVVAAWAVPAYAALDADQQALLRQAEAQLKKAEADLDAATSSAGTAANPAKGSRLKLTQMRLDSAQQALGQSAEALGKLPAEDDAVKTEQARHDAAAARHAQITAIITPDAPAPAPAPADKPGDAPAPPTEAKPAPADAPKLHYKQEEQLKNARFHLREAQAAGNAAAQGVAKLDADAASVVHADVVRALQSLDRADEKLKLAQGNLDALPAEHPQVQPVVGEAKALADTLGATRSRLVAEEARLGKLAGMGNYPKYDEDFALLQELARRYGNFQATAEQPDTMAQVIREDGAALGEVQRIAKTYLPLVEQKTDAGVKMEKQFNYFQSQRGRFAEQLMAYKATLPGAFEADIAEAMKLAEQGVNEQKPLFFGPESGIEQRFSFAEDKLKVIEAFGAEEAGPYVERLSAARAEVAAMARSLEAQIIASNQMPPDRFTGADREAIIAKATEAWKKLQPDAQVLAATIPAEAWQRDTRWQWFNDSFYKIDASRVQVQLIVGFDEKLAAIRPVNVSKNHLKGDTLAASPFDTPEAPVLPQFKLMRERVKP